MEEEKGGDERKKEIRGALGAIFEQMHADLGREESCWE